VDLVLCVEPVPLKPSLDTEPLDFDERVEFDKEKPCGSTGEPVELAPTLAPKSLPSVPVDLVLCVEPVPLTPFLDAEPLDFDERLEFDMEKKKLSASGDLLSFLGASQCFFGCDHCAATRSYLFLAASALILDVSALV